MGGRGHREVNGVRWTVRRAGWALRGGEVVELEESFLLTAEQVSVSVIMEVIPKAPVIPGTHFKALSSVKCYIDFHLLHN